MEHETRAGGGTGRGKPTADEGHPMMPVWFAETRPAAVIIVPQNCFTDFRPVVFVTSALTDANRQSNAVLIRDERDARPFPDDARDFRARFSKIHKH